MNNITIINITPTCNTLFPNMAINFIEYNAALTKAIPCAAK